MLDIAAYVPGDDRSSAATVFKLSSNETPLGPSPLAVEAYRANADRLHVYPDGSARILREAIAAAYGLNPERIVCGNGSDELLTLLAQTYLSPGDEAIFTEHGFLVYRIAILAAGGDAGRRAGDATRRPTSTRSSRASRRARGSSISPTRTTRPAPTSPTTR